MNLVRRHIEALALDLIGHILVHVNSMRSLSSLTCGTCMNFPRKFLRFISRTSHVFKILERLAEGFTNCIHHP